jgi:hypothetical protein
VAVEKFRREKSAETTSEGSNPNHGRPSLLAKEKTAVLVKCRVVQKTSF